MPALNVTAQGQTVYEQITALKARADQLIRAHRKDADLYQLLADCLHVCEQAIATGSIDNLKGEFITRRRAETKRRVYFEKDADIYLIVGRMVFDEKKNRQAGWRYTATLRQAAQRGVTSGQLPEYLATHGGINSLFKTRPVAARLATTRVLNLNTAVTVIKDTPFTLTLRRDPRGFFDVLHQENDHAPA